MLTNLALKSGAIHGAIPTRVPICPARQYRVPTSDNVIASASRIVSGEDFHREDASCSERAEPGKPRQKVLLTGLSRLVRECIALTIQDQCPQLEVIEIDLDKVTDGVDGGFPNVVIVSIGGARVTDSRVSKILEFFRQTPSRPSVLIISNNDEEAEAMTALRLGSAGFFSSGGGIKLLVAAINLVMAGGRYIPPEFVNKLGTADPSRQS